MAAKMRRSPWKEPTELRSRWRSSLVLVGDKVKNEPFLLVGGWGTMKAVLEEAALNGFSATVI
ncbi:MAG: hypothetical protein HC890_11650 [Chloroflexaceae bacterium]|nr:hypothetical protein [Chloroflexaceae bacterium]